MEDLTDWATRLESEGTRLRNAMLAGDDRVEAMLSTTLRELHKAQPSNDTHWSAGQALLLLRSLLVPFCGAGAASATIEHAVRRSAANRILRSHNWALFVRNLSEAVESICGSAAGCLVGKAGMSFTVVDEGV
ncbi:MAG: hypothetical protein H7039_05690 [Bryobacteraceae bacterium]|nr:hypothetical protein [Bryobacteraceae bacterium]